MVSRSFSQMQPPNYEEIEQLFIKWWAENYPMTHPGPHAIRTHAAFALFLLNLESTQSLR